MARVNALDFSSLDNLAVHTSSVLGQGGGGGGALNHYVGWNGSPRPKVVTLNWLKSPSSPHLSIFKLPLSSSCPYRRTPW